MRDNEIMEEYRKYEPYFGNWYLKRYIGEGAFAKVFEIVRNDFGTEYTSALKIITVSKNKSEMADMKSEGMSERDIKDSLRGIAEDTVKEIQLMYKLRGNGNIVGYEDHEVVEHEDGLGWDILIKMELLTSLGNYVTQQKGQIAKKDIIKLGIDICKALETCQTYNIIHRDIKADNILVAENGEFKLGDFGLARIIERKDIQLSKKGTSAYMAPEVYKGQTYTSAVDIYSLGIVMYRLMNNNRAPFLPPYPQPISLDERDRALMLRMRGEKFPRPAQMSKGRLPEIVMKACAYRPEDRYSSPIAMRQELEAIYHSKDPANKEKIMIYKSSEGEINLSESQENMEGIPQENTVSRGVEEEKTDQSAPKDESAVKETGKEPGKIEKQKAEKEKAEKSPKKKPEKIFKKQSGNGKRNRIVAYIAGVVAALAVVIGIGAAVLSNTGSGGKNTLMAVDELPESDDFFLTSDIPRGLIGTVIFEDSLDTMPSSDIIEVWDVSQSGNGQIMAWALRPEGRIAGNYDFYIAADGGVDAGKDISYLFANMINLESIQMNGNFHTKNAEDMTGLFLQCYNLSELDMSSFDTSSAVNMSNMFNACESLYSLDLSKFDTSHVTDMHSMFFDCKTMMYLDVSSFDTRRVTDMGSMFSVCSSLIGLDVDSFDTSEVTSMAYMFNGCRNLYGLDVSGFNTANVTDVEAMFKGCAGLSGIDVSNFDPDMIAAMEIP